MIQIEAMIETLKRQRNEALDGVALLNGQISVLRAEIEALKAQIDGESNG